MNYTLLAGFISFSLVSGFTPGPNNLIALATGANFGYRRTLPHVLGVVLGATVAMAALADQYFWIMAMAIAAGGLTVIFWKTRNGK